MRRLSTLLAVLTLTVPLMFFGCAGNDGATGPAGPPGPGGGPGPGVLASETCVVCHGQGQFVDVRTMHRLNTDGTLTQGGTITSAITGVTFTPSGDNIITAVTFTFAAFNQAGLNITSNIDLTTNNGTQYSYARFTIAKLVPGTNGDPNTWYDYANGQRVLPRLVNNGGGSYTYTFVDNTVSISGGLVGAANAFLDNATTRAAIQISGLPVALFTADPLLLAPVANVILDVVTNAGVGTVSTAVRRDIVTTAACNACHDPLALHGGGRRDTRICVTCHNPTLPPDGSLVRLVHKIHSSDNNIVIGTRIFTQFGEVTFPQDRRNCITCHKGLDGDNWRARPSMEACATCHLISFEFPSPAGLTLHSGGVQATNAGCSTCHPATGIGAVGKSVTRAHTTENQTPNNPYDPPGMVTFRYFIDTVTVDNNNAPVVQFHLQIATADANGVLGPFTDFTLPTDNTGKVTQPAGFSGSPAFLVAYTLPQDGVTSPADYNNLGKAAGQPTSVNIVGLTVSGTAAQYTATLTGAAAAFPPGALMRAVALQGYFTQLNVNLDDVPPLDNVGRHTPAVIRAVTGDAVRRVIVKSGYNATTGAPEGCLECHEIFEGHGGNRVNNVQVCVVCHNVNLTSSARTITGSPINPAITGLIPLGSTTPLGSDPLLYPEIANNFKELIHGIHSADVPGKSIPFVDIRNRTSGGLVGVLVYGPEITYPGNLRHCTKCHYANAVPAGSGGTTQSYKVELPVSVLPTTQKITTGNPAETVAEINAARTAVPNQTDLVNTPISSACYYCHTSDVRADHFRLQGGSIAAQRSTVDLTAAPMFLMPDLLATP